MPRSFGEPLTKLRAVPIIDNGEPLVDPTTLSSRVVFAEHHPVMTHLTRTPKVRKRVAEMIAESADRLPDGINMTIIEGFRPIENQRWQHDYVLKQFAEKHPEWPKAVLHRQANILSAPPEDKCPPPHITGGAIDVTLIDAATGVWLDMSSPYEMGPDGAATAVKGLTEQAAKNRQILIDALTPSGITNYTGEWWHWSYGDSGWALRVGAPHALYGRLENPNL